VCGRFSQAERTHWLARLYGAEPDDELPEGSYNVAPTDPIRIVIEERRRLTGARWGFLPFWAGTDGRRVPTWINARAETAWSSPAFGPALRKQRCIIPADAFYEWDRSGPVPQPYAIGAVRPGELLAFAGIWAPPARGAARPSAAIITTVPNALLATLHNRMPVVLGRELIDAWLDLAATTDDLIPLLAPAADDALRMWPVSTAVNRVGTNGPDLLRPIELPASLLLA
jgi:putative SOS response-associated peptidase YedK